jgi:streptogramin lyase/mono/diheme cytochrome c family protein
MGIPTRFFGVVFSSFLLLGCTDQPSESDQRLASDRVSDELAAYGQLSGQVTGSEPGVLPVVDAYNTARNVSYTVFVVNGHYRAVTLIPGPYDVTVRPAVGQLEGFTPQTIKLEVVAGGQSQADFALQDVGPVPNYAGGMSYPGANIAPYDEVYPPGPGRDIMERTCHGCHTPYMFSYNVVRTYPTGRPLHDKAGWAITVDRMHKSPAFGRTGKASLFDPALLSPEDRDIVVDYLADNFGLDAEPRAVELTSEPELDLEALEKAMFVAYIFPNTPDVPQRFTQQIDFDTDGNVWVADRGQPGNIVWVDPRTGESRDYAGHGGGHGIAVDQTDGTVWYSGDVVRHLDPQTGLVDHWKIGDDRWLGSNTQVFDSKGNLWLSLLAVGGLGKWDRNTDSIVYWDVPVLRSRPYGIIVDHEDVVWFADYHNSGLTSFDPDTETFRHYQLLEHQPTNIRRPGVDSKGMIWASTWGSLGMQNGALYRLNPATGEVMERKFDIEFTNPYTSEADEFDRIWVGTDNYLVMYDQGEDTFTHYPVPVRTDMPKTTIARGGAVWFTPRNAGQSGEYGGAAGVLYPDKDNITTLAAYHAESSAGYALRKYNGPASPKVTGGDRASPLGAQNADAYAEFAQANGLLDEEDAAAAEAGRRAVEDLLRGTEVERAD